MSVLSPTQAQQRDNLCGPFHAARFLRDAGIAEVDGEPLDQDLVALHAGTTLPEVEVGPQVPPGAANLRDYRYDLERVGDGRAGTPASKLALAIEELSGGRLVCVPLSGEWSAAAVTKLIDAAAGARLLANLRTGRLWGSRPSLEAVLAALDGAEVPDPPAADWDVGHFVELMRLVRGPGGALVLVHDSYPTLGWQGVHLQPPDALAAALNRGDGRKGGVLVVAAPELAGHLSELVAELGLEVKMWDNRS